MARPGSWGRAGAGAVPAPRSAGLLRASSAPALLWPSGGDPALDINPWL